MSASCRASSELFRTGWPRASRFWMGEPLRKNAPHWMNFELHSCTMQNWQKAGSFGINLSCANFQSRPHNWSDDNSREKVTRCSEGKFETDALPRSQRIASEGLSEVLTVAAPFGLTALTSLKATRRLKRGDLQSVAVMVIYL